MQKVILPAIFLVVGVICALLARSFAADEAAFEAQAERVPGRVERIESVVRFNGRDSEDVTQVVVSFATRGGVAVTAPAAVATTWGIAEGSAVDVLYKPEEPKTIQVRAGFFNRSSPVVFFTVFSAFWVAMAGGIAALLAWALRRAR
ncbi:MAG: hypothetical protein AMXMBFR64_17580 [Myxococcales bacterium]